MQITQISKETSTLSQTSLSGTFHTSPTNPTDGQFSISYTTPPDNNPEAAAAKVPQNICVWQVAAIDTIYKQKPLSIHQIDPSDPSSSGVMTIPNIQRTSEDPFIIGYCYGTPDDKESHPIAAVLVFSPGTNTGVPTTPALSWPTVIGGEELLVSFATPAGNNPYKFKNWYGLADGTGVTNDGNQSWIKNIPCDSSMTSPTSTAYFDNIPFIVNHPYTFAFGYEGPAGSQTVGMYYTFFAPSS